MYIETRLSHTEQYNTTSPKYISNFLGLQSLDCSKLLLFKINIKAVSEFCTSIKLGGTCFTAVLCHVQVFLNFCEEPPILAHCLHCLVVSQVESYKTN